MEDKNTDGDRKIPPSIPANYISILHLQERWIKEKERKRKEEDEEKEEERRRKQQAEEHQTIEEDLKKAEEHLVENRANRKHRGRNSKKNESIDAGEARWAEKEETAAIRSERGEDEGLPEKKKGVRKRYNSKKKRTNQEVAAVKEGVVDECGSTAPPEYVVTENRTPAKEAVLVYRKKGEKATAIETQFEDLSINRADERGETKNLKAQTRSRNRDRRKQKHVMETATTVWVKKGQNERADDGNASGVKPLNA